MFRVVVSAPRGNALHAVRRGGEQLLRSLNAGADDVGKEGRIEVLFIQRVKVAAARAALCRRARRAPRGGDAAEGEHALEIVADNRFSEESALHVPNDYMSYGGVTRAVSVERIGSAYVRSVHVTPECVGGKWRAHVRVCVVNLEERAPMSVEVGAAGEKLAFGARTMPAGESVLEGTLLPADVRTWSPASPALYTVTVRLFRDGTPVDDLVDRFGFREVRVEGKRILLNGAPLRVRGVCRHEGHPHYGCALPFASKAHDLALIRDLGANSVRPRTMNNKGVFDEYRRLKLCAEVVKKIFRET